MFSGSCNCSKQSRGQQTHNMYEPLQQLIYCSGSPQSAKSLSGAPRRHLACLFVCLSPPYSPNGRTDLNETWHACSPGACVVRILSKFRIPSSVAMATAKNRFFGRQCQLCAPFSRQRRPKSKFGVDHALRNIVSFRSSPLSAL